MVYLQNIELRVGTYFDGMRGHQPRGWHGIRENADAGYNDLLPILLRGERESPDPAEVFDADESGGKYIWNANRIDGL